VQSDPVRDMQLRPAQDVELHLRDEGRRVKRRYTIRHARRDAGELDLDVLLHGAGAGANWGTTAQPGDEIRFQGPRGKLEVTPADWHLFCGDESALPAIAAICESLPPDERALAVLEVQSTADQLPVAADVRWVARGACAAGTPAVLLDATAALTLPAGRGHAYLLGETRSMVALRAHLEARGLAHDSIFVKGYWNVGRPDRIAGRRPGAARES
jgi:NADPH-dependent ferric siderophore reductase